MPLLAHGYTHEHEVTDKIRVCKHVKHTHIAIDVRFYSTHTVICTDVNTHTYINRYDHDVHYQPLLHHGNTNAVGWISWDLMPCRMMWWSAAPYARPCARPIVDLSRPRRLPLGESVVTLLSCSDESDFEYQNSPEKWVLKRVFHLWDCSFGLLFVRGLILAPGFPMPFSQSTKLVNGVEHISFTSWLK